MRFLNACKYVVPQSLAALVLLTFAPVAAILAGEPPAKKPDPQPAAKPITAASGPLAELLKKWHAEGTAAGNTGDWYDNRDREHSGLNMSLYPQLQKVEYPEEARQRRLDWAAQRTVLPLVVFGNSSTSAGPQQGGSNPRRQYSHPLGLKLLHLQYTSNNLYIYPEHCDYDPGHNGTPGFGDLYPTNTPYLIISQGSSGSDQPFMHAVASTLAAFRPETKKRLADAGLLMPTIQMIFRASNKHLADPKEYLSGKAHPPVFQGGDVDALKMAQMAHEITPETLPPVVLLEVDEEDAAVPGRDYFEENASPVLGDTTAVIARICRSRSAQHRIVVSAAKSYAPSHQPLKWHWVVLRGDAARIKVKPLDTHGSRAEIAVPWHERRPIAEGSPMESNRVDIGVIVHDGKYYSAPGFVTFFFLDNEARTYDDAGRLLEIGYGMGESDVNVTNWAALEDLLKAGTNTPAVRILKKAFSDAERAALVEAIAEYRSRHAALEAAREQRKQAETQKKPEAELKTVREAEQVAVKAEEESLNKRRDALQGPLKDTLVGRLRRMIGNPAFHVEMAAAVGDLLQEPKHKVTMADLHKRFVGWGLFDAPQDKIVLRGVRGVTAPDAARLTRFEKALLEQFHAELVNRMVLPGVVQCPWRLNYVDPSISAPKTWRDVYHYDAQGVCTGWTRYDGQQTTDFTAEGLMVLEKDARGRCLKARAVRYEQDKPKGEDPRRRFGFNSSPLRCLPAGEVVFYEYANDADTKGRTVKREKETPEEKK
jgi:hypothetical protein